jgi:hypothetical protein
MPASCLHVRVYARVCMHAFASHAASEKCLLHVRMNVYKQMYVCRKHSIPEEMTDVFFHKLQKQAFAHPNEILEEVEYAAQRLWTSDLRMA